MRPNDDSASCKATKTQDVLLRVRWFYTGEHLKEWLRVEMQMPVAHLKSLSDEFLCALSLPLRELRNE